MSKKKNYKHFRVRDAPTDWVGSLEPCNFRKITKLQTLKQLELWQDENQNESDIIKFPEAE